MSQGEHNLAVLLKSMQPVLQDGEFVFCTAADAGGVNAIGTFQETEGFTLICRREEAERCGLSFTYICRMITLKVHSSLEAVGFLAAISSELARRGIGMNVVSAYFHDHLFVAVSDAGKAMETLREIQGASQL
jgi:uncharacterized protein